MVRSIGHIAGVWTVDEYLEIGRKLVLAKVSRSISCRFAREELAIYGDLEQRILKNIGKNLLLPHGINIVINENVIIGNGVVIYQGVTVGKIHEGPRKGVPITGDRVTIGPNAVVVGGIHIGHDSFLVGNSFVIFDVPPHSLVLGRPGVIHQRRARELN